MAAPITFLAAAALLFAGGPGPERPYLAAARSAARWLESVAVETDAGLTWPAAPALAATGRFPSLYAGSPGVVLFFLELSAAEPDPALGSSWLQLARRGADELLTSVEVASESERSSAAAGLYTGRAGVGFALLEAWRLTGEERYERGALAVLEALHAAAPIEAGSASFGGVTDVIAGDAGVAFFLLYAGRTLGRSRDIELAAALGRSLVGRAAGATGGTELDWPMSPGYARRMPNFSHGTAGIAALLAVLAEETGDEELLVAARAGARHVLAVADRAQGGLRVPHHLPGGEDLFYVGWCHGPVGTSRLFLTLARVTGDVVWLDAVERARASLLACNLPTGRTRGYWNNVGRCCGAAGVVEFLLDRRDRTGSDEDLPLIRALADDVLDRGRRGEAGGGQTLSWIQAEHRARPDLLLEQTGLMQGAAGIGRMLLHLDAALRGTRPLIRLPEDHAWRAPTRPR